MIQVFSTRKDKPTVYPFLSPRSLGVDAKQYLSANPIEFAISPDGKSWTSCFDIPNLDGVYCYQAPGVQPASRTDTLKKIGLQDGSRLLSTSYNTREITMHIICEHATNEASAMLAYDALQKLLISREAYWVCFANWPQRMYYVMAKMSAPTFTGSHWTCDVTFTDLIGLSRSVATSTDYQDNNGFGNNMPVDQQQYVFTTNHFFVNNLSDTIIDPERRGHPLVITLEGHSDGKLKIVNKTTGEEFDRDGGLNTTASGNAPVADSHFDGTWKLDGVRKTLNGKPDELHGSPDVFTLQPGKNEFQIENFTGKVTFDFPFWWLS